MTTATSPRPKTGGRKAGTPNKPRRAAAATDLIASAGARAREANAKTDANYADPIPDGLGESGPKFPPYRLAKVDTLIPYEKNPRTHSPEQVALIAALITEYGFTNPVLVDGKRGVIAGHGRVLAAKMLGMDVVPAIELSHLNAAQRRAYVIADNASALKASWDDDLLLGELTDLRDAGFDLSLTGFDGVELDALFGTGTEGQTDPDDAPEVQAEAVSRLGDVWLMGAHRLLCGDCTDAATVETVMDGKRAALMNTDPPYGVDYAAVKNGIPRPGFKNIQRDKGDIVNDNLTDGATLQTFLESAIRAAVPHLIDRAAFYFWHPMLTQGTFFAAAAAAAADILIHRQIIWVKRGFVLTRSGMYHWRHELCFYGWRRGHMPAWLGNKSQTSVWDDLRDEGGDHEHPTQKPVELFERPILNHTKRGDAIYEPFAGSGSQIIAAEMTGRACFGIEIEPRYIDVAVRRWQSFTGQSATLADDGRAFAEIEAERLTPEAKMQTAPATRKRRAA
jgi:DNA modification methylase